MKKQQVPKTINIVTHPPLEIDTHCRNGGSYGLSTHIMTINPIRCQKEAKEFKMDNTEYIARVINHEFLHHLLTVEHGETVSKGLDELIYIGSDKYNIKLVQKYLDVWLW